jgi:pyridoxal phosphate enzyme (YggS family)
VAGVIGPTGEPAVTGRDPRAAELAGNLAAVRGRLAAACVAAGRRPEEVTLIAVTKTFPARDVRRLVALGVTDVGENRDQEARAKTADLADLSGVRWHFVGRLQRNKVNHVVGYADVVHAVDRPELVTALAAAAERSRQRPLDALVQVNLDTDPEEAAHRGGAAPGDVPALADRVAAAGSLRLVGLMAVAPLGGDPEPAFARLAEIAARLRADHPAARMLSAGMSADLEAAIRHGATHVRVGTALLGGRTRPVR